MSTEDLNAEREALRDLVQRFAESEIAPHADAWDQAGEFPRTLYGRAAELGLLGLGYPEELGGTPASYHFKLPAWVALARHGKSGGVLASLFSHNIGLPPVVAYASDAVRREVVPAVLRGERIAALAITEPGGGSDVAALRTTARRDGDHYVLHGEKTFITSGMRADWITVAVRTGESRGAGGISMLLVPGDLPGLTRTRLSKMGWLCSDTAQLHFDGVRVPARYLLGEDGAGFRMIMGNFNGERIGLAAGALGFAQASTRPWPGPANARPSARPSSATRPCATSWSRCRPRSPPPRPGSKPSPPPAMRTPRQAGPTTPAGSRRSAC